MFAWIFCSNWFTFLCVNWVANRPYVFASCPGLFAQTAVGRVKSHRMQKHTGAYLWKSVPAFERSIIFARNLCFASIVFRFERRIVRGHRGTIHHMASHWYHISTEHLAHSLKYSVTREIVDTGADDHRIRIISANDCIRSTSTYSTGGGAQFQLLWPLWNWTPMQITQRSEICDENTLYL